MKRIFLLLAFFSCFLIVSMAIIPSAQSSMVKDEIENSIYYTINKLKNKINIISKLGVIAPIFVCTFFYPGD